jgi:hypothetical protein
VIDLPTTSSVAQPNSRPASLLQLVMMPLTVLLIYCGTADSPMEASHIHSKMASASPSWVISLVAARQPRLLPARICSSNLCRHFEFAAVKSVRRSMNSWLRARTSQCLTIRGSQPSAPDRLFCRLGVGIECALTALPDLLTSFRSMIR